MKTRSLLRFLGQACLAFCSVFGVASLGHAQTSATNTLPRVYIVATQPIASQAGQPGQFTVFRIGDTNESLLVFYQIGGTASNGVDYAKIGQTVPIPAGATSNTITITPINSGQAAAVKTVDLMLTGSPTLPPVNYEIVCPDRARVYIEAIGVTNVPPFVALTSPAEGQEFAAPANIPLIAVTGDLDGYVTSVEFFAGTNSLGVSTNWAVVDPIAPYNPPPCPPPGNRAFFLDWTNVPPGAYVLTAKATDNNGNSSTSSPVDIVVTTITNHGPVVKITSPPNNSVFRAPVTIPIIAFAAEPGGVISGVEFFDGTNDLGPGRGICVAATPLGLTTPTNAPCPYTNIFVLIWSNPPLGSNILTAVATDSSGVSVISPPVQVFVLPPVPPPTNKPPIMSIIASDPIAIEGTNCWPLPWAASWPVAVSGAVTFSNLCGPKDAQFTVLRTGETNDAITVTYNIGGTASNGVDYVALSGSVTVQAGQRKAPITIIPIDDGPPDITSTVVLALNTNAVTSSNNYVLGYPQRAAAIILDSGGPAPCTAMLPGGLFHVNECGPDGAWFQLQCSTNLSDWTTISTNQVVNGCIDFVDPDAQNNTVRFYRAVPEAVPPSY